MLASDSIRPVGVSGMPNTSSHVQGARVLCVGGGIEQVPIIRLAQQMGLHVTAIDSNPRAAGLSVADRGSAVDLRNLDAVTRLAAAAEICALLPSPLGAILTTAGAVNDALRLRGISHAAAHLCTDKRATHRCLAEAGIPTPKSAMAATGLEITETAETTIGFPAVVKPMSGSGSRGVFVARSKAELLRWLPWHLEQRLRTSLPECTIVEQYIAGQEVGVDGVVVDQAYASLLIRDKEVTDMPFRLPYAFLAPSYLCEGAQRQISETLAAAVAALKLRDCLVHADVILALDGTAYVVDVSGRPSGFSISTRMVPSATGVDSIRQAIRLSLGSAASFQPLYQRGAVLRMLSAPRGRLRSVEGFDEVRQMPGVVAAETFLHPGEPIEERRTGASYATGYLLTSAATRDQASALWEQAASVIHFSVDSEVPR